MKFALATLLLTAVVAVAATGSGCATVYNPEDSTCTGSMSGKMHYTVSVS